MSGPGEPLPTVAVAATGMAAAPGSEAGVAAGDAEASAYLRMAYVFALSLVGRRDEARDVAQDAMVRLLRHRRALGPQPDVRPWLLTTVRNLVRDRWRRARLRPTDSIEATEIVQSLRAPGATPEQALERRQTEERLWQALAGLPGDKREILVLRDFHDLSYAEIAGVLGIPIGTVMSRLHAARTALRTALGRSTSHG